MPHDDVNSGRRPGGVRRLTPQRIENRQDHLRQNQRTVAAAESAQNVPDKLLRRIEQMSQCHRQYRLAPDNRWYPRRVCRKPRLCSFCRSARVQSFAEFGSWLLKDQFERTTTCRFLHLTFTLPPISLAELCFGLDCIRRFRKEAQRSFDHINKCRKSSGRPRLTAAVSGIHIAPYPNFDRFDDMLRPHLHIVIRTYKKGGRDDILGELRKRAVKIHGTSRVELLSDQMHYRNPSCAENQKRKQKYQEKDARSLLGYIADPYGKHKAKGRDRDSLARLVVACEAELSRGAKFHQATSIKVPVPEVHYAHEYTHTSKPLQTIDLADLETADLLAR